MPAASYEIPSFNAMAEQTTIRGSYRPSTVSGAAPAWVPNGRGAQHQRSKGLPSQLEWNALRRGLATDHALLSERCEAAESAMSRVEGKLDMLVTSVEAHVRALPAHLDQCGSNAP
jgi:hypothetical protein